MVVIYTFPECPYCKELKEIYDNKGVTYREVNILLQENQEEWKQVVEVSKAQEVPVVKIGKQLLIPNISFTTIKECYETTKRFLN